MCHVGQTKVLDDTKMRKNSHRDTQGWSRVKHFLQVCTFLVTSANLVQWKWCVHMFCKNNQLIGTWNILHKSCKQCAWTIKYSIHWCTKFNCLLGSWQKVMLAIALPGDAIICLFWLLEFYGNVECISLMIYGLGILLIAINGFLFRCVPNHMKQFYLFETFAILSYVEYSLILSWGLVSHTSLELRIMIQYILLWDRSQILHQQ